MCPQSGNYLELSASDSSRLAGASLDDARLVGSLQAVSSLDEFHRKQAVRVLFLVAGTIIAGHGSVRDTISMHLHAQDKIHAGVRIPHPDLYIPSLRSE